MNQIDRSNDDERVRDHLANERTFLAWVRTAVATMGMGLVIAKSGFIMGARKDNIATLSDDVGLFFAIVGVGIICSALYFFLRTQKEIRTATYTAHRGLAIIFAALMVLLGLLIVWYSKQPVI